MKLYENKQMSEDRIREYLGQKALFFSVLAGYSRTPNTTPVRFNEKQVEAIEKARKVFDIHLTILNTPLDDDSANPEQRDMDREHQSGIDVNRVDFYTNSMGTVSTAIDKDEDEEGIDYSDDYSFSDAEEGLTVNEIYSYSNAASKFRRDMIGAAKLLDQAIENKSLNISEMSRLYSLLSSIKSNSFVERDLIGYDPFNDLTLQGRKGSVQVRDDATMEAFNGLMNMVSNELEPTEGVNLLAQQGLSITLGNSFYNDLMSADILDKGRMNTFRNGLESNLISRTEKNAVNNGDVFADLMIKNSKKLEEAAWQQYQAVKDMFGESEGMTMLANIQVVYQKTLEKINRNIPVLDKDIAARQAALKEMAGKIGMENDVDYTLDAEINLSSEDIDSFIARNDVLESISLNNNLDIEKNPAFMKAVEDYNAAYIDFAGKKKRLYDTLSFLADPINANSVASLQNLIILPQARMEFIRTLNENPHLMKPLLYNATELAVLRSKYINDVNSSVRIYRSPEELQIKPRSREEMKIIANLQAIEKRIGDEDNGSALRELVEGIKRENVSREMKEFLSQKEIAPFFGKNTADGLTDYYMKSAGLVDRFCDEFYEAGEHLAEAGSRLNAMMRESLAVSQVEYLEGVTQLSAEEKYALTSKFMKDAVFATYAKNIYKDRVFNSTDEELSVVNNVKAEYGNATSLVYGSACPVSVRDNCLIVNRNSIFHDSQKLNELAGNVKNLILDMNGSKALSEDEAATVRENIEKDSNELYEAMKGEIERGVQDASARLARYSEERELMSAFNPDVQIAYGYEARKVFDDFVSGKDREENFVKLQNLLGGIVRNNYSEADNVKKINAYLIREAVTDGSANQFATEFMKSGLLDDEAHYTLEDVKPVVDTLMIAGEENKKLLSEFRRTGDHTKLRRIENPDIKDKNRFENMIVTTYNGFFRDEKLEEIRKEMNRAKTDQMIWDNNLEELRECSPRVYAYGNIASAAIAAGLSDNAEVEFFKEKTKEFENTLLKEKGYSILKNVSNLQYGKEGQYLQNAENFYNSVTQALTDREKSPSPEKDEALKSLIFRTNEDYAHPVQEMYRREKNSGGKYSMSSAAVASISPESTLQRYSLSVLPSENFNMAAFKTTIDSKDKAMGDFLNVKNLYAQVKGQSIYTYPVNKGIDTFYRMGLDNLNVKRSVADAEKQLTPYGRALSEAKKADRSFNQDLKTFAIKNLPHTQEYIDGFKKTLKNRGVRADLVDSMQFVPSKKTNNTVVNISSDVLSRCTQKDQLKLKAAVTDIYIREREGKNAPNVSIVGNESAKARIISTINRTYSEMSKGSKTMERSASSSRSRSGAF